MSNCLLNKENIQAVQASYYNLPNVVCMYVWMLMKGSVSFDPNNAIFTQNIHEGMGRVNNYIQPK